MTTFTLGGESFTFIPKEDLTFAEAAEVEKVTGFPFIDVLNKPHAAGSILTSQALLWISMRRVKPETKFADLGGLGFDDFKWPEEAEESEESEDEADGDAEDVAPDPTPDEG